MKSFPLYAAGARIWSLGKYHLLLSLLLSILSSTLTAFTTENTPVLFSSLIPGDPEIALINQSSDNEQWIITMGGGLLNAMSWKKKKEKKTPPCSPWEVFIWDLRIWMFLRLSLEIFVLVFLPLTLSLTSKAPAASPFPLSALHLLHFLYAASLFLSWKSKLTGFTVRLSCL